MFTLPTCETSVVNPYDYFSNLNFTCNMKPIYRWRQHKLHTCRKCQAHGITTSLKGHVNCPNKNCACLQCSNISTQRIEAVIRKRRRKTLVRLEEAHHANVQMYTLFNIPTDTVIKSGSSSWTENVNGSSLQNNSIVAPFRNELENIAPHNNQVIQIPKVNGVMSSENIVQPNSTNIQQVAQNPNIQFPSMDWINLLYLVNYLHHPSSINSSL